MSAIRYAVGDDAVELDGGVVHVLVGGREIAYVSRDEVECADVETACAVAGGVLSGDEIDPGSDDVETIERAVAALRCVYIEPGASRVSARHIARIPYGDSIVTLGVTTIGGEAVKILAIADTSSLFFLVRRDDGAFEMVHRFVPTSVVRDVLYRSGIETARAIEDDYGHSVRDDA